MPYNTCADPYDPISPMPKLPSLVLFLLTLSLLVGFTWGCQSSPPEIATPDREPVSSATVGSVLERVKQRGKVICGVNGRLAGFSYVNEAGEWSGLEVDFCRAIAAGVLGDGQAVIFRPVTAQDRFIALKKGQIDVLLRNTSWVLSRSADPEISFTPVLFFDSQSILVARRTKGGFPRLADLEQQPICTEAGDRTADLEQLLRSRQISAQLRSFTDTFSALQAFNQGQCRAVSLALSQLQSWRRLQKQPTNFRLLPITFGREPLSAAVSSSDPQWRNIVTWIIFATIYAEEQGINQNNYRQFQTSTDKDIARFLGTEGSLGISLGLAPDWTTQILQSVGNYGDIYTRNLAEVPRGQNNLAKNGGLLLSMPFR